MFSEDEMAEMAPDVLKMMETRGWRFYVQVIGEKIQMVKEQAIDDDPGQLLFHRGSIKGMIAAVQTANDIMNTARQTTGEKDEARFRSARDVSGLSSFE